MLSIEINIFPVWIFRKNKLNDFVLNEIRKCIKDNEDLIIQEASKYLAEKMAKTKAVKEAIKDVVEQNKQ